MYAALASVLIDVSISPPHPTLRSSFQMHWPIALEVHGDHPFPQREDGSRALDTKRKVSETWADMEKYALATGKAKAIGVSNVSQPVMEELLAAAKTVPAANQIETHPFLPEHDLVRYLQSKNIVPQAYSPLGSAGAPVLDDEVIVSIAKAKGVQPGQVAISWQAQRGVAVLPKSVTESRIIANGKQISLTDDEMKQINELYLQPGKLRRTCMPAVSSLTGAPGGWGGKKNAGCLQVFGLTAADVYPCAPPATTVGRRSQIRQLPTAWPARQGVGGGDKWRSLRVLLLATTCCWRADTCVREPEIDYVR